MDQSSSDGAWGDFLDSALAVLNESEYSDGFNIGGRFILEVSETTPWESPETWLDKDSNSKIEKTKKVNRFTRGGKRVEFRPFIINLIPASQSGLNVCICATGDCARHCLHTAGNVGAMADKTISRARKTWMLFFDPDEAFRQIAMQIARKKEKVDKENANNKKTHIQMTVRLNGTSDVVWRAVKGVEGKTLFELFPDIVFYDYVKLPFEMESFMRKMDEAGKPYPKNYHMTFSYGGTWNKSHQSVLDQGHNVTVAFGPGKMASKDYQIFPKDMGHLIRNVLYPSHVKTKQERKDYLKAIMDKVEEEGNFLSPEELAPFAGQALLPGLYKCHEVIDGDEYDARFLDDFLHGDANRSSLEPEDFPDVEGDFFNRPSKDHGLIIGLTSKGSLPFSSYTKEKGWDHDATGFMVGPNDPGLDYGCGLMLNNPSKAAYLKRKTDVFRKIAKATMTIRNFDARHTEPGERVFRSKGDKEGTMTYLSSSRRATQEVDELIKVIQDVMSGVDPQVKIGQRQKESAARTAKSLIAYLQNPDVQKRLTDSNFLTRAVEMGMGMDVNNLIKRIQRLPPGEPRPSILSMDILKRLSGLLGDASRRIRPSWKGQKESVGFKEWLDICEAAMLMSPWEAVQELGLESKVGQNMDEEMLASVYRRIALDMHPDRNPDPEAVGKFKRAAEAFEVLKPFIGSPVPGEGEAPRQSSGSQEYSWEQHAGSWGSFYRDLSRQMAPIGQYSMAEFDAWVRQIVDNQYFQVKNRRRVRYVTFGLELKKGDYYSSPLGSVTNTFRVTGYARKGTGVQRSPEDSIRELFSPQMSRIPEFIVDMKFKNQANHKEAWITMELPSGGYQSVSFFPIVKKEKKAPGVGMKKDEVKDYLSSLGMRLVGSYTAGENYGFVDSGVGYFIQIGSKVVRVIERYRSDYHGTKKIETRNVASEHYGNLTRELLDKYFRFTKARSRQL